MLVLSRKENESIELPELGIVVRVLDLKKSKVQLGVEAPSRVTVMRSEKVDRTARLASYFRPPECPSRQFDKELTRLESQFAALAELADRRDRSLAREVAADAIDRLARLRRQAAELSRPNRRIDPVSDVVTVRAEVIDQLRGVDTADAPPSDKVLTEPAESECCVRQSEAEYVVQRRRPTNQGLLPNRAPHRSRVCVA